MQLLNDLSWRASSVLQRIEDLEKSYEMNSVLLLKSETELKDAESKEELALRAKEAYKMVVDEVYSRSLGEIEEVLNMGLKFIFYDKNYGAKIEVSDFKNKTINMFLYDYDYTPTRVVDMKDGVGTGVRTVASFVLLAYYLVSLNREKFIFADEAYSGISESYVDKFFEFVSSLCQKKGLVFVLITHDTRFLAYGNKKYTVSEGVVREVIETVE
jgi:hypothetical protein